MSNLILLPYQIWYFSPLITITDSSYSVDRRSKLQLRVYKQYVRKFQWRRVGRSIRDEQTGASPLLRLAFKRNGRRANRRVSNSLVEKKEKRRLDGCCAVVPPRTVGGGQIRVREETSGVNQIRIGEETGGSEHLRHVLVVGDEAVGGGSETWRQWGAMIGAITGGRVGAHQ
jgi:hypothetical protein